MGVKFIPPENRPSEECRALQLLWRREAFGYVAGLGLLFQASMLFIVLIVILVLQPLLIDADFLLIDTIVVVVMGMICFVPFALFVRGVMSNRGSGD